MLLHEEIGKQRASLTNGWTALGYSFLRAYVLLH